jgi:hypothetical protein
MKLFCIGVSLAGAMAVAPPRIELNVDAVADVVVNQHLGLKTTAQMAADHTGLLSTISGHTASPHPNTDTHSTPTYDAFGDANGAQQVSVSHDWTAMCDAHDADATSCPLPQAAAFDHNDQETEVDTSVYVVDCQGVPQLEDDLVSPKKLDLPEEVYSYGEGKPCTFLLKYDAEDDSGNKASQVVFALVTNDLQAPAITSCYDSVNNPSVAEIRVEASASSDGYNEFLCDENVVAPVPPRFDPNADFSEQSTLSDGTTAVVTPSASSVSYTAEDTIDGSVNQTLAYTAFSVPLDWVGGCGVGSLGDDATTHSSLAEVKAELSSVLTHNESEAGGLRYVLETTAHDSAGYYGENGENNVAEHCLDIRISDTQAPVIIPVGAAEDDNIVENVAYAECCNTDEVDESECAVNTSRGAHHSGYTEAISYAIDGNDGDISDQVEIFGAFLDETQEPATVYESDAIHVTGRQYTVDLSEVTTSDNHKKIYHWVEDAAGNQGVYPTSGRPYYLRTVKVVDRNPPVIQLVGDPTVTLLSTKSNAQDANYVQNLDEGVTKFDTCKSENALVFDIKWKDGAPGNLKTEGAFTRVYTVCDRNHVTADSITDGCDRSLNNTWAEYTHCCEDADGYAVSCCSSVERTFIVQDQEAPTIHVMGNEQLTLDASTTIQYSDAGATCQDWVDGELSHAVEVSGEVVNMRKPGKYVIRYDCTDLSGRTADSQFRQVDVQDVTCPQITLKGVAVNYLETGFPYVDAGYDAIDDLDGDISNLGDFSDGVAGCRTDGDTVNVAQAFYDKPSCRAIKTECDASEDDCRTGEYYISSFDSSTGAHNQLLVWCDMTGAGKTYYPVMYGIPAVPLHTDQGENTCQSLGMDMALFTDEADLANAKSKFCEDPEDCVFFPETTAKQGQYLCAFGDESAYTVSDSAAPASRASLHGAEAGTYKIRFTCKDKAGNKDCDWQNGTPLTRTVFVKSEVPPVITLHLRNHLEESAAVEEDSELMAETTSTTAVNGWVMGAMASAVTGLALLGYSMRRSNNVVVSVPV